MIYYEPIKTTIDTPGLAEVTFNVVVWHHSLLDLIVSNKSLLFISQFWLLLCYFLGIQQRLSTAFHSQTDGQTKRQNSIIKAYF